VKEVVTARLRRLVLVFAVPFVLAACAAAPEPVHWGVEACAHCQMVISDERFAGQVVDRRGKTYKFDAIECMAGFLNEGAVSGDDVHSVWVADGPDGWVEAGTATFVHSPSVRTPMGGGFTAHVTPSAAAAYAAEVDGELLTWSAVVERARHTPHTDSAVSADYSAHEGH
jgi:copper chaperone NosL